MEILGMNLEEAQRRLRVAVAQNSDAKDFKWLDEEVANIYEDAELKKDCQLYMELTDFYKFTKDVFGKNLSKNEIYERLVNKVWDKRKELPMNIDDVGTIELGTPID